MTQRTSGLRSILSARWVYSGFQAAVGSRRYYEQLVAAYVRPQPGDRILDIGCGPADILGVLGVVDYVGFDSEERYIRSAEERWGGSGARFELGDVSEVDLHDFGSFDVVLAVGVLHHLDDAPAAGVFDIAMRVLNPGGRVVTVDPCHEDGQHPVARLLISNDRGQNVRSAEEYRRLATTRFTDAHVDVRRDLLRVPYSHAIVTSSRSSDAEGV